MDPLALKCFARHMDKLAEVDKRPFAKFTQTMLKKRSKELEGIVNHGPDARIDHDSGSLHVNGGLMR